MELHANGTETVDAATILSSVRMPTVPVKSAVAVVNNTWCVVREEATSVMHSSRLG